MAQATMTREGKRSARKAREHLRRLGWLTEAQAALGWGVIMVLMALLGVIYLNQASQIASVGRRVQTLQIELEELKRNNAGLERQIAESQSLERLQREAEILGFTPADPNEIEYIIVPNYPVVTEQAPIPTPTAAAVPAQSMQEAIWISLRVGLSDLVRGEARE